MKHWLARAVFCLALPGVALADVADLGGAVDGHILPGFRALSQSTEALAGTAQDHCAPEDAALLQAYGQAFDDWIKVSHLRFGPSEEEGRAFALAYWPDPRSKTPKALGQLMAEADPVAESAERYADVSIAARGFYALEYLLYDSEFSGDLPAPQAGYRCQLIQAVTADMAATAAVIWQGWDGDYAARLRAPGENDTYRTEAEAAQQLFTALSGGLEFTSAMRLGRPMGTFDRPRPQRAEARRSGRSLRHVVLSLEAMRELTRYLAAGAPDVAQGLDAAFAKALAEAEALDDPVFAGVATPQGRLHVEVLQQEVEEIRHSLAEDLGPRLGIAAGFNALDGD